MAYFLSNYLRNIDHHLASTSHHVVGPLVFIEYTWTLISINFAFTKCSYFLYVKLKKPWATNITWMQKGIFSSRLKQINGGVCVKCWKKCLSSHSSQWSCRCWSLESYSTTKGRIQVPKHSFGAHLRCLWAHLRCLWIPSMASTRVSRNSPWTNPIISTSWCLRHPGTSQIEQVLTFRQPNPALCAQFRETWIAFHTLLTVPINYTGSLNVKCTQTYSYTWTPTFWCLSPTLTFSSVGYSRHQNWSDTSLVGNLLEPCNSVLEPYIFLINGVK